MSILQKLKSALGLGGARNDPSPADPAVTVEREPSAESERAVKGVQEPNDAPRAPRSASAASAPSEESESEADAPSVREIDGIGPTYAERLEATGLRTVVDLAESDVETVAAAADASEGRAANWVEQAADR
jgi:polyhydroxyalkanoate synthase